MKRRLKKTYEALAGLKLLEESKREKSKNPKSETWKELETLAFKHLKGNRKEANAIERLIKQNGIGPVSKVTAENINDYIHQGRL